jgi:hypothetical protein
VICPSEDALLLDQLGELSVNDSRSLREHVEACGACQTRRAHWARIYDDVKAVAGAHNANDEVFTKRVEQAVRTPQAPAAARSRRWPLLAAAAMLALVPSLWGVLHPSDSGSFSARGSHASGASQAEILLARGGKLLALSGQTLRSSDALGVRVTNPSSRTLHLLAFVRDRAGEIHWLYPAYGDASHNPAAVEIPAGTRTHLLNELVTPDGPAAGPLRLVTVLSPTTLTVREAEARLARGDDPVTQFPEAIVQAWNATWEDTP